MSPEAFQDTSHAPRFDKAGNAKPRMKVRINHYTCMQSVQDGATLRPHVQSLRHQKCWKVLKDVLASDEVIHCMMKAVYDVELLAATKSRAKYKALARSCLLMAPLARFSFQQFLFLAVQEF